MFDKLSLNILMIVNPHEIIDLKSRITEHFQYTESVVYSYHFKIKLLKTTKILLVLFRNSFNML